MTMSERFHLTPDKSGIIGTDSDIHGGMGPIRQLVDITSFVESDSTRDYIREDIQDSRGVYCENGDYLCNLCGYDRAVFRTHTEVEGFSLTCRNCQQTIASDR
jgi:hypothetical protein